MSRRDRSLILGGLACLVVHVLAALPSFSTLVDDAWISARYADNLAAGNGLVYNVGEHVEGYTNLLWVLLLAAFEGLHLPMAPAMAALGLVHSVFLVAGVIVLAWALDPAKSRWALVPGAILAVDSHAAVVATNGIESSQFAAATVWACVCFATGRWAPASVLCFLLPAIRPEGAAVSVAIGIGALWKGRNPAPILATAVGAALVFGTRRAMFGDVFPNTWRAKAHKTLWKQLWFNLDYLAPDAPWWIAIGLLLGVALLLSWRDRIRLWILAITLGLVAVAFSVDMWMPGGRLLLPAVSLTLAVIGSFLGAHLKPRWPYFVGTAAVLGVVGFGPLPAYVRGYDERHCPLPGNEASRATDFVRDHLPAGAVLVTRDAGVLAYHWGVENRVAEIHPRALTQPHPDRKNANFKAYVPNNPELFVATVADPKSTRFYYPEDREQFSRRTVPYRYLGRVSQHYRRHYDFCVRADLDIPPLPPGLVENVNGQRMCEAAPGAKR